MTDHAPEEVIPRRLRRIREERGFTQTDLAEHLDVTNATVWNWEHGGTVPGIETLMDLAEILGCTPNVLLGYDGTEQGDWEPEAGTILVDLDGTARERFRSVAESFQTPVKELAGRILETFAHKIESPTENRETSILPDSPNDAPHYFGREPGA